jgi:hypothetical protein
MKTKNNTLIALFTMLIVAACNQPEKTEPISATVDQVLLTAVEEDDCFDEKMNYWFTEFNQLQAEGYDMYDANLKAVAKVSEKFKNCPSKDIMVASQDILIE